MHFGNYDLVVLQGVPGGVCTLADGLVPEIARAFDFDGLDEFDPTEEALSALIGATSPNRELQKNIEFAQAKLGPHAMQIAIGWHRRAHCLDRVAGSFVAPATTGLPGKIGYGVNMGGVARWARRREAEALGTLAGPDIGTYVLPAGKRIMAPSEHKLVEVWERMEFQRPTEEQFIRRFVESQLRAAWFNARMLPADTTSGDEVYARLLACYPDVIDSTVVIVGNAPSTIQFAGQFRALAQAAAQEQGKTFDQDGYQLYMVGDFFPLATAGEPAATHQNPLSGIGAILRNALFLHRAMLPGALVAA